MHRFKRIHGLHSYCNYNNVLCILFRNYSSTGNIVELTASYVPSTIENRLCDGNFFEPPVNSDKSFTVILPPPNITGTLHLGHALTVTIQDVLIKWNRMKGIDTLWIPGVDHAGIATQVVVEKKIWQQKKQTRHDMGRERFEKEILDWKVEKSDTILQELHSLGVSLNWDKQFFTMDIKLSNSVNEAFVNLYDSGLMYRADYLVNWSCILQSAISDIEIEDLSIKGPTEILVPGYSNSIKFGVLTKIAYKLQNSDEEIVVATTRPETMLGDVAIAVNPLDPRYSSFIGKMVWHPFRDELIPIICDNFVDMEFGTGAVKLTPAHDHNDFEVCKRHNLKTLQIINEKGNIINSSQLFNGIPRYSARNLIIENLHTLHLYRGEEPHPMVVPICSRSKDVVEFLIKPQWFLNCKDMAKKAINNVRDGNLVIEPKQFEKNWFDWLENIREWCVSRQLWWGHRIPVYYCNSKSDPDKKCIIAARNVEEAIQKGILKLEVVETDLNLVQDEDVLDTWFSSGLLPLSLAGWPDNNLAHSKTYPLSLMETGHDILFFWVARMVMLGQQLTGKLPFPKILLHGIICDANGRKMSKSLGNVISPEDVIKGRSLKELENISKCSHLSGILSRDEYVKTLAGQKKMFPQGIPECGVDALRFTLCSHNIQNHFISFDIQECKINKFFGNKIWQATKYTLKWIEKVSESQKLTNVDFVNISNMDKWILSRLSLMVQLVNESLENQEFHNATNALKTFLYYELCDVYLETTKRGLVDNESQMALNHCYTLVTSLDYGLRCLALFMPHLSNHLHQHIANAYPAAIERVTYFPKDLIWRDTSIETDVENVLNVISAIRRLKHIFNITTKHKREVLLVTDNFLYRNYKAIIEDLAHCNEVVIKTHIPDVDLLQYATDKVGNEVDIYLHIPKEVKRELDIDKENLSKRKEKLLIELEKLEIQFGTDGYKKKVNAGLHEKNLKKKVTLEEKITRINYIQTLSREKC